MRPDRALASLSAADELLVHLLTPADCQAQPFPLYRALHASGSIHRSALDGHWYAWRYQDCKQLLIDPRMERRPDTRRLGVEEAQANHRGRSPKRTIIFDRSPDHERVRNTLRPPFRPRDLDKRRRYITQIVDDILDSVDDEIDVMQQLAVPVSVAVSGELIGIDPKDRPGLADLVQASVAGLEGSSSTEALDKAAMADEAIEEYFIRLIERRRSDPGDDLLSYMIHVADTTGELGQDELLGNAIFLFPAGFPSTSSFIGNGLISLLRHPRAFERVRRDPRLLTQAIHEMLRFDGPAHLRFRTAIEPFAVGEGEIQPGDTVMLLIGAANRDPLRFHDPDRFDIDRRNNASLTFGVGPHHCLGAPLARLQAQILFERLLARFSSIEFAGGQAPVQAGLLLRSPRQFRIAVTR